MDGVWSYLPQVASLALRDDDFAWITAEVVALGLPIVSVREGGYNPTIPTPSPNQNPNHTPTFPLPLLPFAPTPAPHPYTLTPNPNPNQVLEGGYALGALSRGVRCHLHALIHGHGDEQR